MAHPPMLRPDPPERRTSPKAASPPAPSPSSRPSQDSGDYADVPPLASLAQDFELHEIVVKVCHTTNATAAAIALLENGEFVCRATTGENAPDLGARLHATQGLSGTCIQTRELQRCDDAESDFRVDAAACRRLKVRSLLAVPLLWDGRLLGVCELFSPRPYAFNDLDMRALLSFARQILRAVAAPVAVEEATEPAPVEVAEAPTPPPSVVMPEVLPADDEVPVFLYPPEPPRDYGTPLLIIGVIAVALALGWLLGNTAWRKGQGPEMSSHAEASGATSQPPAAVSEESGPVHDPPPASSPFRGSTAPPDPPRPRAAPPAVGGLSVYEKGQLVFEMKPVPRSLRHDSVGDSEGAEATPVRLSPQTATAYLVQRVEPRYPVAARQARIQGTVVLDASVGRDGSVKEIKALSGDSQLVTAAADAVRQWQFRPYAPQGKPVEFATQISLSFTLP